MFAANLRFFFLTAKKKRKKMQKKNEIILHQQNADNQKSSFCHTIKPKQSPLIGIIKCKNRP